MLIGSKKLPYLKTSKEKAVDFINFLKAYLALSKKLSEMSNIRRVLIGHFNEGELADSIDKSLYNVIVGLKSAEQLLESLEKAMPFLEAVEEEEKQKLLC